MEISREEFEELWEYYTSLNKNPKMIEIKKKYRRVIGHFVVANAERLKAEARSQYNAYDGGPEVPVITIFNNFLDGLESIIREDVVDAGFSTGIAYMLKRHYCAFFYRQTLPNLR